LITVLQDLSQMKDRLGTRATSAVSNHRAKMVVGGISDLATTDYFSRLAGMAEFVHRSTSTGHARDGHSTTEGDTYRELAPQHLLRELEVGTAMLAYGNCPTTKISLRPWFEVV
jgi:type IV secretory pathway TraG/TraD family ATPase VirD4